MQVRAPRPDDAQALFDLVAASDLAELGFVDYELTAAVEELTQPGLDPQRDAWLIADRDRLAEYASVVPRADTAQVRVELYVAPDAPESVSALLLRRVRRRSSEHAAASGLPVVVASGYAPATPGSRSAALLAADGWRPVRRFSRMWIDVDPGLETRAPLPHSTRLLTGEDADVRAVHAVIMASFPDHFSHTAEPFEAWLAGQRARAGYDRELWLLAEVDGEPAGALIGSHMDEQGWVGALGVRPEFRRQGLAHLLLRASFAVFAQRGYHRVALGVDTESTTEAYRLYESAGMHPGVATDCYQIEIPANLSV